MNFYFKHQKKNNQGFTLIEMLVSVTIFVIVAFVITGALLVVVQAYRKAQAGKLLVDNLNFTMENIVLNLREGNNYRLLEEKEDENGRKYGEGIVFYSRLKDSNGRNVETAYGSDGTSGRVWKSSCSIPDGQSYCGAGDWSAVSRQAVVSLTAPEVKVVAEDGLSSGLRFYLTKEDEGYSRVIIVLRGQVVKRDQTTTFQVQSTISQRNL